MIGASHRSLGSALGLLAAGLFWNGIVSIFVLVALSGTFHLLDVRVPEWFPAPITNDAPMGTGMVVFLWIFLTPFIVIGMGMILGFLSSLAGKTEARLEGNCGTVFTGIGFLGWTRRFDPGNVQRVTIDPQDPA